MLLTTQIGEENKLQVPAATKKAQGNHDWSREAGYTPKTYEHQEYPKMLFKRRVIAQDGIKAILASVGKSEPKDRQANYLKALEQLAGTGADIREFPLQAPDPEVLKSLLTIIGAKLGNHERAEWMAKHGDKTADDYRAYAASPETVVVASAKELRALGVGWFASPDCKTEPINV